MIETLETIFEASLIVLGIALIWSLVLAGVGTVISLIVSLFKSDPNAQ